MACLPLACQPALHIEVLPIVDRMQRAGNVVQALFDVVASGVPVNSPAVLAVSPVTAPAATESTPVDLQSSLLQQAFANSSATLELVSSPFSSKLLPIT